MRDLPLTVLIADDSQPVAEMLSELVHDPGRVEVIGVQGTEQGAIDAIRAQKPDVVVLDLELKGGSGTNVIRAIRADATLSAVKLMVTSNHASPEIRAGCIGLGADDYFDKVKELARLTSCLAGLASKKEGNDA
jgi:CheY-like chemotaxis protein